VKPVSIIIRMSAIRKLAVEATDDALPGAGLAAGIACGKNAKSALIRDGLRGRRSVQRGTCQAGA
jgi:hypothetical protein